MSPAASPAAAVVIPCFNDGATLEEAVDSVLSQHPTPEIVVVDDGSTDEATLRTIRGLGSRGITILRQPNGGTARARSTGLEHTRAPLVLSLDADDVLEPGALGHLIEVLDREPGAAAAWGGYQRFGDSTTVQRTAQTLDAWQITHQNDLPATALFRRTALEAVGGWTLADGYEDWDLWMSLAERGFSGVGLPGVIYRYRRHGQRRLQADAERNEELVERLRERHPELFASRRRNWRRSTAPLGTRLLLPLLGIVPLSGRRRRLVAGAVTHLADGRGVRLLVARAMHG
ncbi:MAG: glycosyltransferase family 2 protein [Solirubrobacterales bacterium]|nr:glycosyltransferase family 2 protein [Solirubrobacterales bacterium]